MSVSTPSVSTSVSTVILRHTCECPRTPVGTARLLFNTRHTPKCDMQYQLHRQQLVPHEDYDEREEDHVDDHGRSMSLVVECGDSTIAESRAEEVKQVLAIDMDATRTHSLTERDMYRIDQLRWVTDWAWDDTVPIIYVPPSTQVQYGSVRTVSQFQSIISTRWPWVNKLVHRNLPACGGLASVILNGTEAMELHDVDLWLVNRTNAEADYEIQRVANILREEWGVITIYRTAMAITFQRGDIHQTSDATAAVEGTPLVQIILRQYANMSQLLHSFDMGSSAVGYDGTQVWLTGLAKFAYEHRVNIFDMKRWSPSYEHRLCKYILRGFHLVVSCLDIRLIRSAIRVGAPVRFQSMVVQDAKVRSSMVNGSNLIVSLAPVEEEAAAYGVAIYRDAHAIVNQNLHAVSCDPVLTRKLCGWTVIGRTHTDPIDFKSIPVRLYADSDADEVKSDKLAMSIQSCMQRVKTFMPHGADWSHQQMVAYVVARSYLPFRYD
jgi:hypothetical protein